MTLTINPKNQKELRKVKTILKAIEVEFWENEKEHDENAFLNSTEANRKHLEKSMKEGQRGNLEKIAIDDLWK